MAYLLYLAPILIGTAILFYRSRKVGSYIRISEQEADIIDILRKLGGKAYQSDIAKLAGLPRTTAWRYVRRLEERGLVRVVKRNRENLVILK